MKIYEKKAFTSEVPELNSICMTPIIDLHIKEEVEDEELCFDSGHVGNILEHFTYGAI